MDARHPRSHPLVRKLESIVSLSDEERQALVSLPMHVQDLRADQDIVREGDRVSCFCLTALPAATR
jgi:CRP-like cAMP-binding protein